MSLYMVSFPLSLLIYMYIHVLTCYAFKYLQEEYLRKNYLRRKYLQKEYLQKKYLQKEYLLYLLKIFLQKEYLQKKYLHKKFLQKEYLHCILLSVNISTIIKKGANAAVFMVKGKEHDNKLQVLWEKFAKECSVLPRLPHPKSVQYMGIHRGADPLDLALIMKHMPTNLEKALDVCRIKFRLSIQLSILVDVPLDMLYIHLNDVIHRD